MTDVRQRKSAAMPPDSKPKAEEEDRSKQKGRRDDGGPDLEPNIWVVSTMFILFVSVIGSLFYYKVDNRENGPFAAWVNEKYPAINRALNRPRAIPYPAFGAQAAETTGQIQLTEEELKAFDGTDTEKPIYLAINGTIFDVSVSPAFYGPGGHYNHFVGKDATRAWITECWDTPDQFTHRLDDVHVMFLPRWLDEQLAKAADGDLSDLGEIGKMPQDMLSNMAKKSVEKFGSVTDSEKEQRRKEDRIEAEAKAQETLAHWVKFFSGNAKYKIVGTVILEGKPEPPAPCEAAMKKRPTKGGKLESLMGAMGPMMGGAPGGAGAGAGGEIKAGEMPAAVKEQIAKAKKAKEDAEKAKEADVAEDDEEDYVHEEL